MERLTKRDEYGNADIIGVSSDAQFELSFDELNSVTNALNRLAAYEDTGLAPEDCAAYKKFEGNLCASGVPFSRIIELVNAEKAKIAALRPITREQVEKVWRGCPECKPSCGLCVNMNAWDRYGKPDVCNRCVDYSNFESDQKFCECCGSPLTDEAVEMVIERLGALKDEKGN